MRSVRALGGAILVLGVLARPLNAVTYYVATNGADANPGTAEFPWRTIQKAADTMVAGETVIVRAGDYGERVASVRAGTGETARIRFVADGAVRMKAWQIGHAYITVEGFTMRRWSAAVVSDSFVAITKNGRNFRLLKSQICDGIQFAGTNLVFNSDGTIESAGADFAATGFAAGQTVYIGRANDTDTPLNLGARTLASVTNDTLTVVGGLASDGPIAAYLSASYVFGLHTSSSGALIRGNTFRNLGYDCMWVGGVSNMFEQNVFEQGNGWDVMHFSGTDHRFSHNHFRDSHPLVYQISPDLFENWPIEYKRVSFTDNFVENCVTVFASQKLNDTASGPLHVARNVMLDVGVFRVKFANTTFENNTVVRMGRSNTSGVFGSVRHPVVIHTELGATNALIRNNIFVGCGGATPTFPEETVGWYEITGPADAVSVGGNYVAGDAPGYAAKTGFDEGTPWLNGGDPGFVNVNDPLGPDGIPFSADDGLRLQSDSKLRGAGIGRLDIGAYVEECPLLAIAREDGALLGVLWSTALDGFALETAPAVTGAWSRLQAVPVVENGFYRVTVAPADRIGFFRLAK